MAWLREAIDTSGLSVRRVAIALDVAPQTVYDWDAGKIRPRDDHARKIADLLGLDEIDVRRGLGLWVPPKTEQQAQLELAAIRRRIAILQESARTKRERDVLEQLRQLVG